MGGFVHIRDEKIALTGDILKCGSEEDTQVLHRVVKGLKEKRESIYSSYIGAILNMNWDAASFNSTVSFPITPALFNSLRIVHGGVTATMIDSAMRILANQLVPEGYGAVTNQLNVHYIATIRGGKMTSTANLLHQGNRTIALEGGYSL
ncbi:PaaI family thioesterase [Jeotgalibacillus soli]|uniref:Thioesterase domain-containing protein n=1 Tax=Jeotgalibacillus soli TaxID=889306 RepID=A0A0C2R3C3_9BACL|nr:PaaI family thioesterase [Jeotgalibacillus soli]KIL44765.1 hypothetical protein KP78_23090 [Jeotgalibacillus soli]